MHNYKYKEKIHTFKCQQEYICIYIYCNKELPYWLKRIWVVTTLCRKRIK